jgi:uncharacterized protein YlxW (UPF0749 family)
MTDYERKRRDECIKLRAEVDVLKKSVKSLRETISRYSKCLDEMTLGLAARRVERCR